MPWKFWFTRPKKADGVKIHTWNDEMMTAFKKANDEVMEEEAKNDADFARAWTSFKKFHEGYREWAQLSRLPAKFR